MPEMEKIITLLDDMRSLADLRIHEIVSPDNWNVYSDLCDLIDLAKESALAMLREQEPAWKNSARNGNCPRQIQPGNTPCASLMMEGRSPSETALVAVAGNRQSIASMPQKVIR